MGKGLNDEGLNVDGLEDPGDRYSLGEVIGQGVHATVYRASDSQVGGKQVAIKVQNLNNETLPNIEEEYKILRDLSDHPNLPDFYGIYKKIQSNGKIEIWFVMQLCSGGPITDLVRALIRQNKRMDEIHIAFILREVLKALVALHENHVMHRDVKGNNILLTEAGEVKLVDFGLSRELPSTLGKKQTSLGSPCWMAPEVVTSKGDKGAYDNRADVWALGITAVELGDGKPPLEDMHPTRALFQIVRNPPPTLYRPANWSQHYNDFIAECLTKNPEHRPFMVELLDHPFFSEMPTNDLHLNVELKTLIESIKDEDRAGRITELTVQAGMARERQEDKPRPLFVEDLAALEVATEDNIVHHLESRYQKGKCYTFVGDVLLFLNPNHPLDIYGYMHNNKYKFKSRSQNEPHIFSVADSSFQNMLHHGAPQNIILSGETLSGKTTMFRLLLRHLMFLSQVSNKIDEKILKAVDILQAFGNAATPINNDSTRHALFTQLTFSRSGKVSGAIFWLYQLEKWRVTGNRNPHHANFHIFYYLYHGLTTKGILDRYQLEENRKYCYLRSNIEETDKDPKCPAGPRENDALSYDKFCTICQYLTDLQFEEAEIELIWKTLAAILLIGEVDYKDDEDGNADIKNEEVVDKVASLLRVDGKKLSWALCNYCVVENDTVARRRHSKAEALEARNVLAQTLYTRLVDWIVNVINLKLSFSRVVYGDFNCINILDIFGFECYDENGIEQLFVNSLNEQLQYFYNQKVFISEMQEIEVEGLPFKKFNFFDNRTTMDEILNKPLGVIHLLDEANRLHQDSSFVTSSLSKKTDAAHVKACNEEEFSIAHYTGKVTYNALAMVSKNRDFLPPEITEVMRFSSETIIKQMFTNKLSKTGNVTLVVEKAAPSISEKSTKKRWGTALLSEKRNVRRYNTASRGEFSQTRGIRTAAAVFRAISLELLRMLSEGSTHFVRCIRTDLTFTPKGFQSNIVRQQLRGLSVVDTARAKLVGYAYRVPFEQFLERYQFLAFDFDENVEQTKDNCRLLLIRLKMEGWYLGNTKVFLKYYNEEYLSRLYESQVKKIVKVQSMLRAFLAKRSVQHKKDPKSQPSINEPVPASSCKTQEEAAVIIQKHLKGYVVRKKYGPLINPLSGKMNEETATFMRPYFKKWKNKSMYQILLKYKAARRFDLVYFSQQVHLYNQNTVSSLTECEKEVVDFKKLQTNVKAENFIGKEPPANWKIPFNIKDLPLCDSSLLCDSTDVRFLIADELPWDDPFKCLDKASQTVISINDDATDLNKLKKNRFQSFIDTPFNRDPTVAEEEYSNQVFNEEEEEERIANETKLIIIATRLNQKKKTEVNEDEVIEEGGISMKLHEGKYLQIENQEDNSEDEDKKQERQGEIEIEEENGHDILVTKTSNILNTTSTSIATSPIKVCSPMKDKLASPYKSKPTTPKKEHSYIIHASPLKVKQSPAKTPLKERTEITQLKEESKGIIDYRKNLRPTVGKTNDPIMELERRGKENASQSGDDPPYNFQAMLRKTNYNDSPRKISEDNSELDSAFKKRSIKKRTNSTKENEEPDNEDFDDTNNYNKEVNGNVFIPEYNGNGEIPRNIEIVNNNMVEAKNNNNTNLQRTSSKSDKKKTFSRKDSLDSIKMMLSATKDFKSSSPIVENGNLDQTGDDIITTELVPGLIIVGKLTEL